MSRSGKCLAFVAVCVVAMAGCSKDKLETTGSSAPSVMLESMGVGSTVFGEAPAVVVKFDRDNYAVMSESVVGGVDHVDLKFGDRTVPAPVVGVDARTGAALIGPLGAEFTAAELSSTLPQGEFDTIGYSTLGSEDPDRLSQTRQRAKVTTQSSVSPFGISWLGYSPVDPAAVPVAGVGVDDSNRVVGFLGLISPAGEDIALTGANDVIAACDKIRLGGGDQRKVTTGAAQVTQGASSIADPSQFVSLFGMPSSEDRSLEFSWTGAPVVVGVRSGTTEGWDAVSSNTSQALSGIEALLSSQSVSIDAESWAAAAADPLSHDASQRRQTLTVDIAHDQPFVIRIELWSGTPADFSWTSSLPVAPQTSSTEVQPLNPGASAEFPIASGNASDFMVQMSASESYTVDLIGSRSNVDAKIFSPGVSLDATATLALDDVPGVRYVGDGHSGSSGGDERLTFTPTLTGAYRIRVWSSDDALGLASIRVSQGAK